VCGVRCAIIAATAMRMREWWGSWAAVVLMEVGELVKEENDVCVCVCVCEWYVGSPV
jgi:hypothetical protein